MKILIAGSHGMIGAVVARHLAERGHDIVRLVHGKPQEGELHWDPDHAEIDARQLEGFDAVIHLATMTMPFRWSASAKKAMLANRLAMNALLARTLARCEHKPRVLIYASGVGTYAASAEDTLTEDSPVGTSFLSRLDLDGEAAMAPAVEAGIRVVALRLPMVIGGARLLQIGFQAGEGRQWMSWIGLDEVASIVEFALHTEALCGPVNAASPEPLRNAEFAAAACEALEQKCGGAMPALLVRLIMGEFGEEMFLASRRAYPAKLLAAGYRFRFPDLASAVRHEKALYAPLNKNQKQSVSMHS